MLKVVQESNRDEPKGSGVSLLDEIAQTDHEEEAASNTSPAGVLTIYLVGDPIGYRSLPLKPARADSKEGIPGPTFREFH